MTTSVKLISITPEAESLIAYCARVSNPANQEKPVGRLLSYCMEHGHWSVFEMANAVVEINTTRDIARQILRHRSFSFQEFSQRYAEPTLLGNAFVVREARLQDTKNRQNSLEVNDPDLQNWFDYQTWYVQDAARRVYDDAIAKGIAKEVARSVLPEGLTMSRMYVNGSVRSWLTYLKVREDVSTQKEHREVANQVREVLKEHLPNLLGTE
jgi:thymidylate synthase (FAD)